MKTQEELNKITAQILDACITVHAAYMECIGFLLSIWHVSDHLIMPTLSKHQDLV